MVLRKRIEIRAGFRLAVTIYSIFFEVKVDDVSENLWVDVLEIVAVILAENEVFDRRQIPEDHIHRFESLVRLDQNKIIQFGEHGGS